jgi:hypothetical protein
MTDKHTLSEANDKSFANSETFVTPMQRIVTECQHVSKLRSLLDYCNRELLKNFQLNQRGGILLK